MKRLVVLIFSALVLLSGVLCVGAGAANGAPFSGLLSEEEKQYIQQAGVIPTIVSPNKGPIQYIDSDGTQKGITVEVLDKISALTGLRFEYITMSGLQNIQQAVDGGQADIVAGLPPEHTLQEAYRVNFSDDYLSCSYGVIIGRSNSLNNISELTLALATGLDIPEQFRNVQAIKRYGSIQDCINAVQNKEADFAYGNSYVLEFYSQGYRLQNLCVIPLTGEQQDICLGVSKSADPQLLSIMNKAIAHIGGVGLIDILIRNVSVSTEPITLATLISANPLASVAAGLMIVLAIVLIALLLIVNFRLKSHKIRLEHQRYLLASEVSREYFYEYNSRTDTMKISEDAAALFGCKPVFHKWRGRAGRTVPPGAQMSTPIDPFDTEPPLSAEKSETNAEQKADVRLPLKDGTVRWFHVNRVPIYEAGRLTYIIGKLRDVEEEHLELDSLLEKSQCDGLTGLYHADASKHLIGEALKTHGNGAFFIIDLDYFKNVNDRFGHQKGDEVIKSVADIMRKTFREDDILGRLGGDEFIVFVPGLCEQELIESRCRQLRSMVAAIKFPDSNRQTISIGIAMVGKLFTFAELYNRADEALYIVKENGRDGFHLAKQEE